MARSSTEVVAETVKAQERAQQPLVPHHERVANEMFLSAIRLAQTHPEMVATLPVGLVREPEKSILDEVATFLRYADSIDKSLECLSNTCFPAAILFACVRFMLSLAVKEMKLFMDVKAQLLEINHRLRRLDLYLADTNR